MSYPHDRLNDEQVRALREAAQLVSQARSTAADVLSRSGIDPGLVSHGSLHFCTAMQSPGPPIRACGCPGFRGDADFCFSQYHDFTGPDLGGGAIIRICGHPRDAHEVI
ncbi:MULTISPECIES: DUF6422 family protein [Streptomyces]|uniref:DUF6422 family protein n=1 Tax=Streptomyces TaxID=1883 RepID=UPI0009390DEA|nr:MULTISPECIES: DUF6422 family protein [Streptomyces]MBX9423691.1 hypothetical protein [Streptomyces lateritius]OKJ68281.1 hypothetical protein AMK29_09720 [Streptomyces sp. CB02261]